MSSLAGVSTMFFELRPGERLEFHGGLVTVEFERKRGRVARLFVMAPREVPVHKGVAQHDDEVAITNHVPSMV